MDIAELIIVLVAFCLVLLLIDKAWGEWRRRRFSGARFPAEWLGYLERNVPVFNQLPATLKHELQRLIRIFLDEKEFEPCGGIESVTDEMRVTIAGGACLLLLCKKQHAYSRLLSVLVYPEEYWAADEIGEFESEVRAGALWGVGSIVLTWDAGNRTLRDPQEDLNAEVRDLAARLAMVAAPEEEGSPGTDPQGVYRAWARVFGSHYHDLNERMDRGEGTEFDEYGSMNPGEAFALATQAFFADPGMLRDRCDDLYTLMRSIYRVDPACWNERDSL